MARFLEGIAIMFGTIVGAGAFGLPYVMQRLGYVPALFLLAFLAGIVILLHLIYGEVILRTSQTHRLPGYGRLYLGKWGGRFFLVADILAVNGALLAYLILGGSFLSDLFGGSSFLWAVIFWIILSVLVLAGLRTIAKVELALGILLLGAFIILAASIMPSATYENLAGVHPQELFTPFGVMLFALWGLNAVNPVREHFGERAKLLPGAVILGTFIPAAIYAIFAFAIIGAAGPLTPSDALVGMKERFGSLPVMFGLSAGILAVATSFLTLAAYLGDLFRYDERIPRPAAYSIVLVTPLALYFFGMREFISVLGVTGAVLGGISGALLIAVYYVARKKGDRVPEYRISLPMSVLVIIFVVLILGSFAELLRALHIL